MHRRSSDGFNLVTRSRALEFDNGQSVLANELMTDLVATRLELEQVLRTLSFVVRREKNGRRRTTELEKEIQELKIENLDLRKEKHLRDEYIESLRQRQNFQCVETRTSREEEAVSVVDRKLPVASVADQERQFSERITSTRTVVRYAIEDLKYRKLQRHRRFARTPSGTYGSASSSETDFEIASSTPEADGDTVSSSCSWDESKSMGEVERQAPSLIDAEAIQIQAMIRGFVSCRRYARSSRAIRAVQALVRGYLARKSSRNGVRGAEKKTLLDSCAKIIQSFIRRFLIVRWYKNVIRTTVFLQSCARRYLARKPTEGPHLTTEKKGQDSGAAEVKTMISSFKACRKHLRLVRSVVAVQTCVRGYLVRRSFERLRAKEREDSGAVRIQAIVRGFIEVHRFTHVVKSIVAVQSYARAYFARKRAMDLRKKRLGPFWWRSSAGKQRRTRVGRTFRSNGYREMSCQRLQGAAPNSEATTAEVNCDDNRTAWSGRALDRRKDHGVGLNQEVTHLFRDSAKPPVAIGHHTQ